MEEAAGVGKEGRKGERKVRRKGEWKVWNEGKTEWEKGMIHGREEVLGGRRGKRGS